MFEVGKLKSELHLAYPNVIRPLNFILSTLNFYTHTQQHELSSDWLGPWIGTSQFKVPANGSIVHRQPAQAEFRPQFLPIYPSGTSHATSQNLFATNLSPRMFEFAANAATLVSTFLMSEPHRALRSAKRCNAISRSFIGVVKCNGRSMLNIASRKRSRFLHHAIHTSQFRTIR